MVVDVLEELGIGHCCVCGDCLGGSKACMRKIKIKIKRCKKVWAENQGWNRRSPIRSLRDPIINGATPHAVTLREVICTPRGLHRSHRPSPTWVTGLLATVFLTKPAIAFVSPSVPSSFLFFPPKPLRPLATDSNG